MQYPVSNSETGMGRNDRAVFRGIDDLVPDVKYILPKCDAEITIRKTLAEAAQRFCRDTGVLEATADIPVVNDQHQYELPVSDYNADLLSVKSVSLIQATSDPDNDLFLFTILPNAYWIDDPIEDDAVYLNLRSSIKNPVGPYTQSLRVVMTLLPLFDQSVGTSAYAFPDKFLRRWRQAIVDGAIVTLAGMDGRPWANTGLANMRMRSYYDRVAEAQNKVNFNRMADGTASCVNSVGFV